MSLNTKTHVSLGNGNQHVVNAPGAPGATAAQPEISPAVAGFRRRFFSDSRLGLLMSLDEVPEECQQMLESQPAWQYGRKCARVRFTENMAALIAPEDNQRAAHLQRLEDSCLSRMWRLINTFGKVQEGILQRRKFNYVRSKPECV
jgi:hypothetical protein